MTKKQGHKGAKQMCLGGNIRVEDGTFPLSEQHNLGTISNPCTPMHVA